MFSLLDHTVVSPWPQSGTGSHCGLHSPGQPGRHGNELHQGYTGNRDTDRGESEGERDSWCNTVIWGDTAETPWNDKQDYIENYNVKEKEVLDVCGGSHSLSHYSLWEGRSYISFIHWLLKHFETQTKLCFLLTSCIACRVIRKCVMKTNTKTSSEPVKCLYVYCTLKIVGGKCAEKIN